MLVPGWVFFLVVQVREYVLSNGKGIEGNDRRISGEALLSNG